MPIIYSYPTSTDLLKSDILIGSSTRTVNGQKKNVTKNFSLEGIYTFLNETNAIAIAGQNNFFFQKTIAPVRQQGSISFAAGGGANTPFNNISTLRFSKYSTAGNIVLQYLQSLVGHNVILAQTDDLNNFGVYILDSFTQVVGEPNFYDASFTHVVSNGSILEDKFYGFAFYSEVVGPSGVESVTGNIVNNTDPLNPVVTQVQPDWGASSGLGQILNKPAIPTKTSDLVNDGEDGISPFISQVTVQDFPDRDSFPTIGQNGVIYIAEDTDLAYTWDSNTMDYVLTTMPDTGITGIGKTNRIAKFNSPTNIVWSKISEDQFGGVKIADSNRSFLSGNSVLSIQRSQNQLDFVMGNSNINQPVEIISDNTGGGLEIKSKGILSLKAGASYLEGIKVLTDGKLQITQSPDTGTTSDLVLVRDSSGNVKTVAYPVATGFVPYTGATQDVDLGEYELKAGQIELDQSPTGTAGVAVTRWNNTMGVSETTLKGGNVILKNGVDLVARVVNKVTPSTTLTKADYQVVRISGAQGQRLAVQLAQANNDNNSADTLGVVIETIPTNQEGFIMTVGQLEDINTTGSLQGETWSDGDVLYLSPTTAGMLTNVKPSAPGHIVVIGYVEYAHAVHGKIYVKIMNGWELDELHNVAITSPANNQGLVYETATDLWKNKTINKSFVGLSDVDNTSDLDKPISTATQTALNTKTTILYSSALRSAIHTGTTANTIVFNQLIPANSIINGQTIEIEGKFSKLNTSTLSWNVRYYINNSVSLVGAIEIGFLNFASVSNAQCGTLRRRVGRRGSNIVYYPIVTATTDFQNNATTSISVASVDWSQPQYILIAIQLAGASHQTVIEQLNIVAI